MARAPQKAGSKERRLTPLWIISLFLGLTELVIGAALTQVTGGIQVALTAFAIAFPSVVAIAFFLILWHRPWVFYSPSEYGEIDVTEYVDALAKARFSKLTTRTADLPDEVKVVGNPDRFALLFKAAGSSWKKSTKAMDVGIGCVVQVTTEQLNPDGTVNSAEAITFVPGVTIEQDPAGDGRHLAPRKA